jgi:cytidylate kinase
VVFPDAFCKFFLTASLDERARRRHAEFMARGEAVTLESVRQELQDRDARDAARAIAPMKPAADASVIDTTGLALDQVIARIEHDVCDRLRAAAEVPGSERTCRGEGAGRAGA